ncbi:MAG TPA: hypothetical protein VI819_00535 [Patescibacteria group bacterium]|nr:hypothetical protein [Patescibacteria group bacterium]
MIFETALLFSALYTLFYLGGQIDISFMEEDAYKYWKGIDRNAKSRIKEGFKKYFGNSLKKSDDITGGGGDGWGDEFTEEGATRFPGKPVAPASPFLRQIKN